MMSGISRRPVSFPQGFSSLFGDMANLGTRAYENLFAPYRVSRDGELTHLSVNLAGYRKEDIDISVDEVESLLLVSAGVERSHDTAREDVKPDEDLSEVLSEVPEEASGTVSRGFYNKSVDMRFTLPDNVDFESISSEYADGVLKVTIGTKVPEKVEPRTISIN
jgi:HSP20 family molecular chaperone IbpA